MQHLVEEHFILQTMEIMIWKIIIMQLSKDGFHQIIECGGDMKMKDYFKMQKIN